MEKEAKYTTYDKEAIKKLSDFLPDKIFDAHAHLFDTDHLPNVHSSKLPHIIGDLESYREAMLPMLCNPGTLRLNMIVFPDSSMSAIDSKTCKDSDLFLVEQLNKNCENVGEIIVRPNETTDKILSRLIHPGIRGLKCYYSLANSKSPQYASIGEYLPDSAWQVANEKKLCITLHLARDYALSDNDNLSYIRNMAESFPNATLILAHAARAFASWTAVEAIEKISDLDNVIFDFSAVCEIPAMLQIIKKAGIKRCLWGSDYPISIMRGKSVSIGNSFIWLYEKDIPSNIHPWLIGIENLTAIKQLCKLAELNKGDVEDLFYNNASNLWK